MKTKGLQMVTNAWKYAALVVLLFSLGTTSAWASSTTYYANLTISKTGETGKGKVYYATSNSKPSSETSGALKSAGSTTQNANQTYYWWVDVDPGYNVTLTGKITAGPATAATLSGNVACAQSSSSGSGTSYSATANIVAVTVNSVTPTSKDLAPTDPSADYPFTVTFTTSNLKTIALDLNKSPETADGKFTITNWALDGTNVVATGKFNGGGTYGGASRNNSTTISLQSKAAGSGVKSCTVTANFPALEFVGATETDVYTTTNDATKTGTAEFNFNYGAADDFTSAPTFTHTSGAGAFTVVGDPVIEPDFSAGTCKVTVEYQFNPNGTAGTTKEELKITSVGGLVSSVTVTGEAEAEATDDAKVIAADGTTLIYQGDWATALSKANTAANAGCTLQLLRDVDLGTLAATQSVTNTFTLDLNGKTLRGTVSSSVPRLLYVNKASKTLTIIDSKTGGKISATGTYANALYCIQINNGNVILNSGSLEITNENTSTTTADRLYATGVYVNSGKTFTMNGGSITANRGARDAYGIYVAASATARGKATINNGTINVNAKTYGYGIRGYGDIIINDGTINVNNTASYPFGVYVRASANATASSGIAGSLTMSGGTINSTATTTYAYGIYMQTSTVGTGETETPEGTHSNQECGVLKITGGTIRVINNGNVASTNQYAYGIYMDGDYSSKSAKHITQTIKNLNLYVEGSRYIYGIYAAAGAQTNSACNKADVALTDNTVEVFANQSVTAYAVYVGAASRTIYTAGSAVYAGEYAAAAKATINSGTYTARTTTYSAYAVCSATRAKTTFAPDTTLGGNAEAYPTIIIKGGEFNAYPTTTTARAVSSGGNTTITGGTFNAIAGTSTAYGIYSVAGDLNVTGVEVNAEATGTAVGVYVDCAVATITGFSYYTNATLKNLTVTATTRTGAEADGVMIANYKRNLTEATLKSDSTNNKWSAASYLMYKKIYNYGEFAVAPKCTIIGGTYTAKAATTTAYGVRLNGPAISADSDGDGNVAVAYGQLDIDNAEIIAQTNGTTTCYGVWAGGPTTINRCNITASSKTTTCCGLLIEAGKTTLTNSTITATGDATVRGIYVNARIAAVSSTQNVNTEFAGVAGMECIGELEATNNTVTATATNGNTAYGIYLHAVKGNTASGPFAGDHAIAGKATINSGKYTATATGTTAYALGMAAQQVQVAGSVVGRPEITVNNGKFWGKADGGTDGCVDGNGQMNYVVLKGGYYNVNTNLSKYVFEGLNVNSITSGPEYDEGYRYTISSKATGAPVCKVYQNGTTDKGSYATLKEALQFVNANQSNTYSIVMIDNHTLPKGNYVLPAKATLVVPSSLTQTKAYGDSPERQNIATPAPVQFLMLTFDKGVNMTVYGGIETTAKQNAANGGSAITGAPTGNYGRLHLVEGSKITLESGSKLNCWGYCTGKGEITAMSGSTVREGFQLGYWRGGAATKNMLDNKTSWHAFPVTDYFIQNVEAPILFRPGSDMYGYSAIYWTLGLEKVDAVHLLGSTNAMFLMEAADVSANTWVKKEYDPGTDRGIWTVNSGAKLGQLSFSLYYDINSADFYLPISNNMTIYINEGEFTVTQDALLIPGAQIIISKLGKLTVSSGKRLFVMDNEDWPGFYKTDNTTFLRWYYNATYSPSWTTNPRTTQYPPTTTPLPDAEIFVHGTTEGQYYTTEHGANIHSTNADAGVVRFIAAAGANTSIQHVVNTECNRRTLNFTSAKLKNEDTSNPYTSTAGTVAGDAYTYMDQMWVNVKENGCLLTKTDGTGTHDLAHPSDVVAVVANTDDNAYHSETGSRNFIFAEKKVTTAGCVWWEAEKVTTGTYAGDYMANKEQFDNYGGYYYWDNSSGYWKPRTVTVTWKNYDGTALATYSNVIYNTSPKYTSASPKVPANTSTATYAWTGWDDPQGNFHHRDSVLPRVTGNITYTAHIQETKYEYLITFKNDAGKVIHTEMFEAGTVPVCPTEKLVKDPTASQVFTFSNWQGYAAGASLPAVTAAATYTAVFTASPRKYTVTFVDYDMSFLVDTLISYGTVAKYPTTLHDEPYRESTDAFSYEWIGWTKTLATVTKDVTYVAKYKQTTIKYKVVFKSDCWGQNDGDEGCVEKIHSQKDYALGATVVVPANPSRTATAQYTYTFDHWDPAVVSTVEAGGATYTAVYTKTPRAYAINYKDKNNAAFSGTHGSGYPTTHTYGTATNLVNPTKTGYDFEGWYSVADCSSGKITAVPADVAAAYTVYANWTPKTNTAYTVKHFKQNIDGTYNETPDDTDNLTGTTAENVTPDRKTYTGFTSPAAQTKKVLADGSLVIEYKYTRNSYRLTWVLAGGKVTVAGTGAAVDATGSPNSTVKFDDAITAPTVTRTGYIFGGWDVTPAAKMPAAATTYTAQWTQAVAKVDAEGEETSYHATVASAITAANALTNPTVTMLQNASTTEQTISITMTIDLNGKTISSTQTTAKTGVFKINAANETVTIRDGGSGGKIEHIANCTGYLYGINLFAGSLNMEGGYIYAENTKDAASSSSYRACGIMYASDYTNPASVTMSGGIVEAKRKRTYAYGICLYTANCELTMTGGEVKASGTGNIRGIYMGGTAKLTNVSVSATATGTNNCYAIFSDSNGAFTINSGTYTATGEGTDVYPISVTKASNASVGGSVTVNGGRFSGKDKELYVSGGTAILQGGYYVHNTDLASNCATNYHVFNLAGQSPYLYEVAEGYKVTWDATTNGGTCATPYTVVKKGNTIGALPVATKDNYSFDGWFTTYTGAGGNQVATTTVINFAITYYARFTPNTYNITYKNKDNAAFNGTHEDGYPTTHTYGTETPLDSPTRTGYTFEGYYTSSDCSTGKVTSLSATGYTSAITLYANWTPNVYNITYLDQNGAAFSGVHGDGYPTTHTYATATTLVSPTKVGYFFKGWYTASDCASGKVTSLAATTYTADVTLYALWTESTTTPYTVEHYQQNIVDDNYTLFATENKTGTTGAVVTPAVKSYTGFTVPSTQTKTIAADGSMVIKYYYTRNSYQLTWDANGGTLSGTYTSGTVKFGATITAPTATRTGYEFSAWSPALVETMPASAKSFKATWTCVSPSNLTIASEGNKWDFCAGETMTLTVSGDDIAADAKYQWKKWNSSTSTWSNISGATSASYSVTMAAANALQYCCAVTNGTCATQSDGVWVRVWQLYINNGASNGWKTLDFTNSGANTGSNATVALTADKTYQFKLKDNTGGWYGLNDKTVTRTEGAFALNGTGADVNITAGMTGDYTFTINYADKNYPTIAITYPTANQPNNRNIYFDKSVITGWTSESAADIFLRIGKPSHNKNNVTDGTSWTLVPGTDRFYTIKTLAYDGFEAWQIANNASWTGNDKSIYLVNTGDQYAITKATNFQKYVVGESGVTIVPTTSNNTENGCNYWNVAVTEGMLTHTATITTPTNGTITLAYTDVNNAAQSKTVTTSGLAHRTILTITATPETGYRLESLTVNGAAFTSGNTHILSADATIAATFVPITYTIRFNANGGEGSMPDESFNYTEEKALTSNSFTRTGYTFEGWATSAGGSVVYTDGKKVINLSTVDGTVIDLYAIWSLDDTGPYLDIVDWTDDATNGTTLTLNLNGIPASGWPYTINGTEYQKTDRAADRTLTIPRQHAADWNMEILVVGQNGVYSKHSYTIPRVYNENASVSGSHPSAILYVRNGVTLTITDETSVNAIFVAPQAELVVNSGVALTVDTLVLRTTPWKAAVLENQGTITAKKTYYTRQVADNSGYFQFALPLASTIEDAHLSDYSKCTYGKSWILKSYSESLRAKNGDVNTETTSNWVLLEKQAEGKTTIAATTGYELYSNSQYYREFYFPVNLKQAGKTTSVTVTHTHYDDGAGKANEGWNAICSPLLGKFVQDFGANPEEGLKVSELLDNGQYWQHVLPVIYPAIPFYYQAPKNGYLEFSTKLLLNAPRRAWNASVPTQWLQLTINDDKGRMLDETSIYTHPEKFELGYETGYDVAKQSLTGGKATIYTELACGKLAFAAIPDSIAETRVPVTVYAGADKEYTFSMRENNYLTRLQYVLLHDTETGAVTDLLQSDYTCELTQGTTAGRFYIQCVFVNEASTVTTEVENVSDDSQERLEKVQKILYQDKVYIIYQGRVYDMTGRQCELK